MPRMWLAAEASRVIVIWVALGIALVVHEGSHYLLLRLAGLHPRPSFHFPGLGWRFNTEGASPRQLISIWLVGPLMEGLVWASAAWLFPAQAWELLLVMVVEMGTNLLLPGSDGRRAYRLLRRIRQTAVPAAATAAPPSTVGSTTAVSAFARMHLWSRPPAGRRR